MNLFSAPFVSLELLDADKFSIKMNQVNLMNKINYEDFPEEMWKIFVKIQNTNGKSIGK